MRRERARPDVRCDAQENLRLQLPCRLMSYGAGQENAAKQMRSVDCTLIASFHMHDGVTLLQCNNDCGRIKLQEEFRSAEDGSVTDAPTAATGRGDGGFDQLCMVRQGVTCRLSDSSRHPSAAGSAKCPNVLLPIASRSASSRLQHVLPRIFGSARDGVCWA
jgi:hypothetical protein